MQATDNIYKFQVLRSSASSVFLDLLESKQKKILTQLREKRYKPAELKMSRRVYSHWKKVGLLDLRETDGTPGLSFLELFWTQVVIELRDFGMSLETIKEVKDYFFADRKSVLFEGYLLRSFMQKDKDFFILISKDGKAEIGTRDEIDLSDMLGFLGVNYIKLNLNVLKNKFYKEKVAVTGQGNFNLFLNEKEVSLLSLIREGDYKEVVLNFSNGVVSRISKKKIDENPDPLKAIRELAQSTDGFSTITIKQANGKFVSMETSIMDKT